MFPRAVQKVTLAGEKAFQQKGGSQGGRGNNRPHPKPLYGLIIIIVVVPRSRVVAEIKPYAWADVHGYAGATVVSPIA